MPGPKSTLSHSHLYNRNSLNADRLSTLAQSSSWRRVCLRVCPAFLFVIPEGNLLLSFPPYQQQIPSSRFASPALAYTKKKQLIAAISSSPRRQSHNSISDSSQKHRLIRTRPLFEETIPCRTLSSSCWNIDRRALVSPSKPDCKLRSHYTKEKCSRPPLSPSRKSRNSPGSFAISSLGSKLATITTFSTPIAPPTFRASTPSRA